VSFSPAWAAAGGQDTGALVTASGENGCRVLGRDRMVREGGIYRVAGVR